MFVEEVRFDASELPAVIDLNAHVKQRKIGVPRFSKMSLAWPSDLQTLYVLRFDCRVGNKFVTLCVTPSRSVVTSAADGAVDKRVWIAVIANPA